MRTSAVFRKKKREEDRHRDKKREIEGEAQGGNDKRQEKTGHTPRDIEHTHTPTPHPHTYTHIHTPFPLPNAHSIRTYIHHPSPHSHPRKGIPISHSLAPPWRLTTRPPLSNARPPACLPSCRLGGSIVGRPVVLPPHLTWSPRRPRRPRPRQAPPRRPTLTLPPATTSIPAARRHPARA